MADRLPSSVAVAAGEATVQEWQDARDERMRCLSAMRDHPVVGGGRRSDRGREGVAGGGPLLTWRWMALGNAAAERDDLDQVGEIDVAGHLADGGAVVEEVAAPVNGLGDAEAWPVVEDDRLDFDAVGAVPYCRTRNLYKPDEAS
ncbi:hypothetical protein [Nonomuraea sp. LPB2021202275-12-8]|uniref:hypothetical protein n=1 Tax=Nonomuraea sp. LPB2021202275-12-8 TaxID=3120159 RepID=UPI00300C73AE